MTMMSIGRVAREAQVRPSAIRYYEEVGLLPKPIRRNGRRMYGPDTVTRLATIRLAQRAGFTISELRVLLRDAGTSRARRALAANKIEELDARISQAVAMRTLLQGFVACECVTEEHCSRWTAALAQR